MTNTRQAPSLSGAPRFIWGADAIGHAIGRSEDYVRKTLARMPGSPISKINGRYVTTEDKLFTFLDRLARINPV